MIYLGLIIVGITLLIFRYQIIEYIVSMDSKNKIPVLREIRELRLIVAAIILIIIGIAGWIEQL